MEDHKDDYLKKAEITINRKTASDDIEPSPIENQADNVEHLNKKNNDNSFINNKDNNSTTNDVSKTLKSNKGKEGKELVITEPVKDGTENDTKNNNNENDEDNDNKSNKDSCIHI